MSTSRFNFDAASFCALPLVRRAYQGLVAGVAVFMVTLVVLHEPFRGYLAEVQLAGPATEGLDLDDAANWLKQADSNIAAIAIPAGEISPKSQIRATFTARLPAPAITRLNELAERWLYQYLPDRLDKHRHAALAELRSTVTAARSREDDAQIQLEWLRQQQLSQMPPPAGERPAPAILPEPATEKPPQLQRVAARPPSENFDKMLEQLLLLRLELSRLLANCTDEHPQIVTLRKQISAIEQQLRLAPSESPPSAPSGPELLQPPAGQQHSRIESNPDSSRPASQYVVAAAAPLLSAGETKKSGGDWSAELKQALDALTRASRERQTAEQRLSERMQQISAQPSAAQWAAGPAHVVTRLGGTPRSSTLALGGLLASIAGILLFRAAPPGCSSAKIDTTSELASVLELPIVGNLSVVRATAARLRSGLLTPGRVRILVHASEAIVAVAVAACLVAVAVEPALARQVLADPFGTLSEVIGRFTA